MVELVFGADGVFRGGTLSRIRAAVPDRAGFQASHLDVEFYDRFYRPEALAASQREHLARWHGG